MSDGFLHEILARTSGSACASARERLVGFADGELGPIDAELVRLHMADCAGCAGLVAALQAMERDLPLLASIEPDARFTREVVARLPRRPGFAAQLGAWVGAVFQRPRIAWEAAYVGTALLWLASAFPGSPIAPMPERVARLWKATASEADSTWNDVTANLSRGLGTLRVGHASEPEKAEPKGD